MISLPFVEAWKPHTEDDITFVEGAESLHGAEPSPNTAFSITCLNPGKKKIYAPCTTKEAVIPFYYFI